MKVWLRPFLIHSGNTIMQYVSNNTVKIDTLTDTYSSSDCQNPLENLHAGSKIVPLWTQGTSMYNLTASIPFL